MKVEWVPLVALLVGPPTFACSPVKSIDVFFPKNSATVSADQVLRVAEWTAMLRVRYPTHQSLSIGANVEKGERGGAELGERRKRAVETLIDDLGFTAAQKVTAAKVHVLQAGALGPGPRNDVKRAELEFLPACPHECPCQDQ